MASKKTQPDAAPPAGPATPEVMRQYRANLIADHGKLEAELTGLQARAQELVGNMNRLVGAIAAVSQLLGPEAVAQDAAA